MEEDIIIKIEQGNLLGTICMPEAATRLVIFAHGSGSSRLSPRNRYVAAEFNNQGIATCLFDLLLLEEENIDQYTAEFRFNIELLSSRLASVTDWLLSGYLSKPMNTGYFGSSTGAAAALVASTRCRTPIRAIVSRGGRPDLARQALSLVNSPTLLIVGGLDEEVITLNQKAYHELASLKDLVIIPGATHLFEETGTLDQVIKQASTWFVQYL